MAMSRKTKLTVWLAVGVVIALSPIWCPLPFLIDRMMAYSMAAYGQQPDETLAQSIEIEMLLTFAALSVSPVGIIIAIVSAGTLIRHKNE